MKGVDTVVTILSLHSQFNDGASKLSLLGIPLMIIIISVFVLICLSVSFLIYRDIRYFSNREYCFSDKLTTTRKIISMIFAFGVVLLCIAMLVIRNISYLSYLTCKPILKNLLIVDCVLTFLSAVIEYVSTKNR